MAKLVIEEFSFFGVIEAGVVVAVPKQPRHGSQTVTFSTETDSAPFRMNTQCVRIQADAKFHYVFGHPDDNPTATTDDPWIVANDREYFVVRAGHIVNVVAG